MKKYLIFLFTAVVAYYSLDFILGSIGIYGLFISLGLSGFNHILFWALIISIAYYVAKRFGGSESESGSGSSSGAPSDFNADYHSKNIAIDLKADKLWLRDMKGKSAVYNKSDILRWETDQEGGGGFLVRCHVKSLDVPFHDVLISKAYTVFSINSERRKRDEWFSRLSVWINHTS